MPRGRQGDHLIRSRYRLRFKDAPWSLRHPKLRNSITAYRAVSAASTRPPICGRQPVDDAIGKDALEHRLCRAACTMHTMARQPPRRSFSETGALIIGEAELSPAVTGRSSDKNRRTGLHAHDRPQGPHRIIDVLDPDPGWRRQQQYVDALLLDMLDDHVELARRR